MEELSLISWASTDLGLLQLVERGRKALIVKTKITTVTKQQQGLEKEEVTQRLELNANTHISLVLRPNPAALCLSPEHLVSPASQGWHKNQGHDRALLAIVPRHDLQQWL